MAEKKSTSKAAVAKKDAPKASDIKAVPAASADKTMKVQQDPYEVKNMSIEDLMSYRKASHLLRDYYANNIHISDNERERSFNQAKYDHYNSRINLIMNELEERINKLK